MRTCENGNYSDAEMYGTPFNRLSHAEVERLAILAEEMGEALQIIGKVLRHGYESARPNGGLLNRELLEKELGDVRYGMIALCEAGDLSKDAIHTYADAKANKIRQYLHYQPSRDRVDNA